MENKTLTTFDIAKHCNVTHRTVRQWISDGKLKSYRTPGNHSRVTFDDFKSFLAKYNMPIPDYIKANDKRRVLVVDDDVILVSIIKELLKRNGDFELETAYDGFSAGKEYSEFKPDLITLDIRMPKMDGLEVLRQIREDKKNHDVKIIVISGFAEEGERKMAKKLGADALFDKPFDNDELISKVKELLALTSLK